MKPDRRYFLLLLPVILSALSWRHPLKMSYTAVKYLPERQCMEVSFRIFQDDFEAALKRNYGFSANILETKDEARTIDYITAYLDQHFDFTANGIEYCFEYRRMKPEQQMGLVLYYEIPGFPMRPATRFEVRNFILMDLFPQQVNMFFLKTSDDFRATRKFTAGDHQDVFNLP